MLMDICQPLMPVNKVVKENAGGCNMNIEAKQASEQILKL